jgi:phospholipase/lecithinase/hemolysin
MREFPPRLPIMPYRALLLVFCAGSLALATPFTSLYFFGDSLTDTGNVAKASSVLNSYTFGAVPQHPAPPYVGGRFTNGPVWAEYVADRLGRPQDAQPAGMSLGWLGRVGGPGNNYAVGGARTGGGGALGLLDIALPTGVFEQVDFYFSKTGGAADPEGLYFILAGGNDLRDAARVSDANQRSEAALQAGANIAYSVRDLYLAGARNFVLINSPDIGLIPESIGDNLSVEGNEVSQQFNTWLRMYADYLRTVPGFQLQYFDLFGLHHDLVAEYGLQAIRGCKDGPTDACDQTLFFDSVHPNARVHKIIGDRIADQFLQGTSAPYLMSDVREVANPEPSTMLLTVSAAAVLIAVKRISGRKSEPLREKH